MKVSTMASFGISICVLSLLVGIQADLYSSKINADGVYTGAGYYWRDFYEDIPHDALPTGNRNYFIGQLIKEKTLVPVLVMKQGHEVVAEYTWAGEVYTQNNNFQILSTTDTSQFEWLKTNADDVHDLIFNKHFVVGGYDDGLPTFIGRSLGSQKIGKVSTYPKWPGLIYARNEDAVRDYNYEILAYKD